MIKKNHLITLSGAVWLFASISLLKLGLKFLWQAKQDSLGYFFPSFIDLIGQTPTFITAFIFALSVGILKGSFVLKKSAMRSISRISALKNPCRLKDLYTPSYLLLLGFMFFLGYLLRVLNISLDVRGVIDLAVGSALLRGSLFFFFAARKEQATGGI